MAQERTVKKIIHDSKLTLKNKYTIKDIKVSKTITKEEFKKNFLISREKIKAKYKNITSIAFDLLLSYFKTKDNHYLEEMKKNLTVYEFINSENLNLEVPEEISSDWLDYVNAANMMKDGVEIMSKADNDSIGALAVVNAFQKIVKNLNVSLNKINLYLSK